MSQFNAPHFQSHEVAREYLEGLRWGSDRICPHCGTVNESFVTKSVVESSHIKLHICYRRSS
jgi:hypothetical protein